jgi:two-component system chemotaxis sensor kinase CheA
MDMSQYRGLFISESREHLRAIGELVVALESGAADRETIDSLFRAAHSLKGMASSMGYGRIATLAHKMEDFMDRFRRGEVVFTAVAADLLLEGADLIEAMIQDVEQELPGEREIDGLQERLAGYSPTVLEEPVLPADDVGKSEAIAEDPLPAVPITDSGVKQEGRRGGAESQQTVRVRTEVLDHLINLTGELITTKHRLMTVGKDVGLPRLDDAIIDLSRLLRELHNEVVLVRMLPFSAISDRFPRMVRDLARKGGKEAAFEIVGKEIELDRGILEELTDPLIHTLRNAVDHGLEPEDERLACGKSPQGKITLSVSREKDLVVVTIEDDGRGMDPAKLIATAVANGLIEPEEGRLMSPREAFLLTCIPGFSTAREVTDVSGRGVGMDAVRTTVQALGGSMAIESEEGRGSRIILKLPLTVAIINVLLATAGPLTVAIPVPAVLRTLEIRRDMVEVCDAQNIFYLDDEPLPLLSLEGTFGLQPVLRSASAIPVFVSEVKGRRVGVAVDRFIGQQEVFVKPLGRPLDRLKGLAGGAVMGDGQIVFILDIANLF